MRNLLFGVILGLFAFVHSTPVNTVTQDDIYLEALTDGYLIDYPLGTSLTTESSKRNTTIQASQQLSSESEKSDINEDSILEESMTSVFPQHGDEHYATTTTSVSHTQSSTSTDDSSSDSSTTQSPQSDFTSSSEPNEAHFTDSDMIEGSALGESMTFMFPQHGGEHYETTTPSASHAQSSTSAVSPRDTEDFSSESSTTQIPQSEFTSVPNEVKSSITPDHISVSQITDSDPSSVDCAATTSSMTSISSTESDAASSASMTAFSKMAPGTTEISEESGSESGSGSGVWVTDLVIKEEANKQSKLFESSQFNKVEEIVNDAPSHNAGHSTPGWIIIVGFIVGVAALVMLCVAIATRDKWNGSRQAPQQTKTNTTSQQRELEMETFLYTDKPRENGNAAEYAVIPLDELPEK